MPEPGSSAGVSGVEDAKAEVEKLNRKLDVVETELGNLKKNLGIANKIKEGEPKSTEELEKAFPNVLIEWDNKPVNSLVKEIRSWLTAEIAELKDKEKNLTNDLRSAREAYMRLLLEKEKLLSKAQDVQLEEKKLLLEKEKQVTAEKEAIARQGPRVSESVRKAAVQSFSKAVAKPSAKSNVDKRKKGSSPQQRQGVTPLSAVQQSKKRAASEPGLDPVPAPDLEGRTATPMAWRVELKVPGGVTRRGLRRGVIELAQVHVGYEGSFDYPKTGDIVTKDTPFVAIVYFETRRDAARFTNAVEKKQLAPRGLDLKDCNLKESNEPHELQNRVYFTSHYDINDSPEAARVDFECTDAPVSISESSHTGISPERIQNESLTERRCDYENAHIIERQACRGALSGLDGDLTNRLILSAYVHKLYDGRFPDFVGPGLSFYCDEKHDDVPRDTPVETKVTMHVFFGEYTGNVLQSMRQSTPTPGDSHRHIFTIRHRDPYRLKVLLNVRYNRDLSSVGGKPRSYTEEELEALKAVCEPPTVTGIDAIEDTSGSSSTTSGSSGSESGDS